MVRGKKRIRQNVNYDNRHFNNRFTYRSLFRTNDNTYKNTIMKLQRWELKIGIVKGLVFGARPYEYRSEEVYEVDHVLYLGIFQIIFTMIYEI